MLWSRASAGSVGSGVSHARDVTVGAHAMMACALSSVSGAVSLCAGVAAMSVWVVLMIAHHTRAVRLKTVAAIKVGRVMDREKAAMVRSNARMTASSAII